MNPEYITKFKYRMTHIKRKVYNIFYMRTDKRVKIFIYIQIGFCYFRKQLLLLQKLGISDIDILRHVISSEADIDIATGNLLKWSSYGIIHWTRDGAGKNVQKTMRKDCRNASTHLYRQ